MHNRLSVVCWTALAASALLGLSALGQEAPVGSGPQLGVFADSFKMSIPGLEGIQLPPQAAAVLGGAGGQRMLRVHLWTPGKPSQASPTASLDVPEGLKLGQTLPLAASQPSGGGTAGPGGGQVPDFELSRYWGCGAAVREGQPKTLRLKDLAPDVIARLPVMRGRGVPSAGSAWTDAAWPAGQQRRPPSVPAGAALPGRYALHSNYAGETSFEVPAAVNFLEPAAITVPAQPDLAQSVSLSWKPVPGAVGYMAMAVGMKGGNKVVLWTSGDRDEDAFAAQADSPDAARALIARGALMGPDHTQCAIPAGIFNGTQATSVQVIALGNSFSQPGNPAVRVQSRSMSMTMLGSLAGGLGGFGNR